MKWFNDSVVSSPGRLLLQATESAPSTLLGLYRVCVVVLLRGHGQRVASLCLCLMLFQVTLHPGWGPPGLLHTGRSHTHCKAWISVHISLTENFCVGSVSLAIAESPTAPALSCEVDSSSQDKLEQDQASSRTVVSDV